MCFGSGGGGSPPAPPPAPPTNTPTPAGRDANQRFQQIRSGMSGGFGESGTVIDKGGGNEAPAKGSTVLGGTY